MKHIRLGDILIQRGIAADKSAAFIIVTEGYVFVNGQKAVSPAQFVSDDAEIDVRRSREYVGRGAYKLKAALDAFDTINIEDRVCADIGAATGGFTEVLLKHGAKKVYAIDTARGKLAPKLRYDTRVIVMEKMDARDLAMLPDRIDLAVIDVSLVSLRNILPALARFLTGNGSIIALFKPQYETRDPAKLYHGVIRDVEDSRQLLNDFIVWAGGNGWNVMNWIESPIKGLKGNTEYLLHMNFTIKK